MKVRPTQICPSSKACAMRAVSMNRLCHQQENGHKRTGWCGWSGSNRHSFRNRILSPARLPISPHPHHLRTAMARPFAVQSASSRALCRPQDYAGSARWQNPVPPSSRKTSCTTRICRWQQAQRLARQANRTSAAEFIIYSSFCPGKGSAASRRARCAALPATILAVLLTVSGVRSKSLKSVDPIASPTQ